MPEVSFEIVGLGVITLCYAAFLLRRWWFSRSRQEKASASSSQTSGRPAPAKETKNKTAVRAFGGSSLIHTIPFVLSSRLQTSVSLVVPFVLCTDEAVLMTVTVHCRMDARRIRISFHNATRDEDRGHASSSVPSFQGRRIPVRLSSPLSIPTSPRHPHRLELTHTHTHTYTYGIPSSLSCYSITMGIRKMSFDEWVEPDNQLAAYHRIRTQRLATRYEKLVQVLPDRPGVARGGAEAGEYAPFSLFLSTVHTHSLSLLGMFIYSKRKNSCTNSPSS